jgi:glutathione S-transferase
MITISAFAQVPDFARGLVRDLRVRWALEEAGLPYQARLLNQGDQGKPDYRLLQPFGQVPIFQEDGLVLFESGAIVLHVAERSAALLPEDPAARARAVQWVFAALNSVEPPIVNVFVIDFVHANEEWAKLRRPGAVEAMNKKIAAVAERLADRPFLDDVRFTAGDLMMSTVLRFHSDVAKRDPRLAAYIDRCTARLAFKRALNAQLSDMREAAQVDAVKMRGG